MENSDFLDRGKIAFGMLAYKKDVCLMRRRYYNEFMTILRDELGRMDILIKQYEDVVVELQTSVDLLTINVDELTKSLTG